MHSHQTLIKLSRVGMHWENRLVLSGIDLDINRGDFLAVTGPNGGGKTTLLRIILKLLHPSTGTVEYFDNGQPTDRLSIGYLPQKNMIDSHFPISVKQVIASGLLSLKNIQKEEKQKLIDNVLDLVDMKNRSDSSIGQLSGGQLQRTLLGRALVSSPDILVLDEPLSYIDKQFEARMYDIISEIAPSTTIILVSHEMSKIATMANRHIIVNQTLHLCTAAHHSFASGCP